MIRKLPFRVLVPLVLLAGHAEGQSLRGSRTSVDLMYDQAVAHGLHFYQTASGIQRAASRGEFVRLTGNADYELGSVSYPYVLPITRTFIDRLAAQYRAACGEKLVVTSAVRPQSMRLANSPERSVHPTGMAIDIRKPTNPRCLSWLREILAYLDGRGLVEAVEERRPPHFHIAVFPDPYGRYIRGGAATTRIASTERTYTVRRGDSLWSIARRTDTTVDALKEANALRSTKIVAGQVLVLPPAESQP